VAEPTIMQVDGRASMVVWTMAAAPPAVLQRQNVTRAGGDATAFTTGLTQLLESQGFKVGLQAHEVDVADAKKLGETFLEGATDVLGGGAGPGLLAGGGADAQEVSEALVPFFPLVDLLALRFAAAGVAILVPVVFADDLAAQDVSRRLDRFLELSPPLAEFGPRIYGTSSASCNTFPLIVYLQPPKYAQSVPSLLPSGFRKKVMARAYLRAAFVDVSNESVAWAERPGFWGLGNRIAAALGRKARDHFNFGPDELRAIAAIARS
jgi:hypothetical protein